MDFKPSEPVDGVCGVPWQLYGVRLGGDVCGVRPIGVVKVGHDLISGPFTGVVVAGIAAGGRAEVVLVLAEVVVVPAGVVAVSLVAAGSLPGLVAGTFGRLGPARTCEGWCG